MASRFSPVMPWRFSAMAK